MTTGIYLPSRQRHYIKPPLGATIDWSHPLARGLTWYAIPGGPHRRELVGGNIGALLTNGGWAGVTPDGPALSSSSNTSGGGYWSRSPAFNTAMSDIANLSIVWRGRVDGWTDWGELIVVPAHTGAWSSPYAAITFHRNAANNYMELWLAQGAGFNAWTQVASAANLVVPATDGFTTYGLSASFAGTTWSVAFYKNGQAFSSGSYDAGANTTTKLGTDNAPVTVLNRSSSDNGEGTSGVCTMAAIWSRTLSAVEMAVVAAEPYTMLVSDPLRKYWLVIKPAVAGGTAIALEGATTGASSATASLSGTTAPLTGTSTAAATASATRLESTKPITGTSAGTSTTTGTLTSTKPLAGTADGVATASATGLLSADAIAGQSDGTSSATASGLLSADALSAATSNGTSDATADLSVSSPGAVTLAGQADGEATATGALINSKPVAGTSAGTSAVTGALSNTKPLTASADGTSGATASIATDKSLGGSATGTSGLTASLQTALALAGSIAGAGNLVGAIGVPIAIIGTADGVGGGSGDLDVSSLQLVELGSAMAGGGLMRQGQQLMSTGSLMRSVR